MPPFAAKESSNLAMSATPTSPLPVLDAASTTCPTNVRWPRLFGDKGAQVEGSSAVWFHARPSPAVVEKAIAANPDAKLWGGVAPELQGLSDVTGCPMYFTPPKYWPGDLAKAYLGGKKVFGILRNPYERLVAMFRGGYSEYGKLSSALSQDLRREWCPQMAHDRPHEWHHWQVR